MIRKTIDETVQNARGGQGSVVFSHILTKDELLGHANLFAILTVKPHSSVGYHQHVGTFEPYYVLSGKGVFIDNDGTRTEVGPGDVCVINVGDSHGIENNTDEDLVMVALILNDKCC